MVGWVPAQAEVPASPRGATLSRVDEHGSQSGRQSVTDSVHWSASTARKVAVAAIPPAGGRRWHDEPWCHCPIFERPRTMHVRASRCPPRGHSTITRPRADGSVGASGVCVGACVVAAVRARATAAARAPALLLLLLRAKQVGPTTVLLRLAGHVAAAALPAGAALAVWPRPASLRRALGNTLEYDSIRRVENLAPPPNATNYKIRLYLCNLLSV